MSWKPSKRQAQLKKRLINSSQVYWETSHTLDQMLLKMLHNNNVYTPDDFYNKYIKTNDMEDAQNDRILKHGVPHHNDEDIKKSINQALVNLDQALRQLKQIINEDH